MNIIKTHTSNTTTNVLIQTSDYFYISTDMVTLFLSLNHEIFEMD